MSNRGELCYSTRIYYDDTDAGGVMYYANYLKLCERAKQEFFLKHSCDLFELHDRGVYLVVKDVKASYKKGIRLGERAEVYVAVLKLKKASLTLEFSIEVEGQQRAYVEIVSVFVDRDLRIVRAPECVRNLPVAEE